MVRKLYLLSGPTAHSSAAKCGQEDGAYAVNKTNHTLRCCHVFGHLEDNIDLQWRHNERNGLSNHRRLNCLFMRKSRKTTKLCVTGLCEGNSLVNSPHKGPVSRKMFPLYDIIMLAWNDSRQHWKTPWYTMGGCNIIWMTAVHPGPWFNIKMSSYQYRKSHCGDKTVVRSSYLHNGISYTSKMSSLYWIGAQFVSNWVTAFLH